MKAQKAPLYRKVNTKARGVHHGFGGDYRHQRNSKASLASDATRATMHGREQRGLDYTPLFKFLLSKVGQPWATVFSEAVARLDRQEPVYWLVARSELDRVDCVRMGETTFFSGLYVDDQGLLQRVNPALTAEAMQRTCTCCTHTFNGIRFPLETDEQYPVPNEA